MDKTQLMHMGCKNMNALLSAVSQKLLVLHMVEQGIKQTMLQNADCKIYSTAQLAATHVFKTDYASQTKFGFTASRHGEHICKPYMVPGQRLVYKTAQA